MKSVEVLRAELEDFRKLTANELPFRKIEKWMIKELEVERLKNVPGSHRIYRHRLLEPYTENGHFQAVPRKNDRIIHRMNFHRQLYPRLNQILDELEALEMKDRQDKE